MLSIRRCFRLTAILLSQLLFHSLAIASPAGDRPIISNFKSTTHEDLNLRYVKDSGVCETTPGVHQVSGYVDVGTNMSMVSDGV